MAAVGIGDRSEAGTASAGYGVLCPGRAGGVATHRTCGPCLYAPGRGRAGEFLSMPHETCGTTIRYTTCVAVIEAQL